MSYNIILTDHFKREAKRLLKKYPSFKTELTEFINELPGNPTMGSPLGKNIFKIRIAINSKGKGKSGGARIIHYVHFDEFTILLLSIYDKGEKDNICEKDIKGLLDKYID